MATNNIEIRNKFKRAKQSVLHASCHQSFLDVIKREKDSFRGLRTLYASNNSGVPLQSEHSISPNWVSVFSKNYLLAWSDEIETVYKQNRNPIIGIASRPLVDTNLWSDIPKVLLNEEFKSRIKAENTLRSLWEHFGADNLDWTFGILENMREAAKTDNSYPIRKIAASRHYLTHGLTRPIGGNFKTYEDSAEKDWQYFLNNSLMWHHVERRDFIYLILLETFLNAWKGLSVVESLRNVCEYCIKNLNTVPLKELYFCWKILLGISTPNLALKAFSEPEMKSPKKTTLKRISALAWDLYLFRWYETQMTEIIPSNNPDTFIFYVPLITTLDEPLLQVLRDCPLQAMIIDDYNGVAEAIFEDEKDFSMCLAETITPDLQNKIDDPERIKKSGKLLNIALSDCILKKENEIHEAVGIIPNY